MIFKSSNYAETTEQKPETGVYILPTNFIQQDLNYCDPRNKAQRRAEADGMQGNGVQGNASAPPCVLKNLPSFSGEFSDHFFLQFLSDCIYQNKCKYCNSNPKIDFHFFPFSIFIVLLFPFLFPNLKLFPINLWGKKSSLSPFLNFPPFFLSYFLSIPFLFPFVIFSPFFPTFSMSLLIPYSFMFFFFPIDYYSSIPNFFPFHFTSFPFPISSPLDFLPHQLMGKKIKPSSSFSLTQFPLLFPFLFLSLPSFPLSVPFPLFPFNFPFLSLFPYFFPHPFPFPHLIFFTFPPLFAFLFPS